MGLLKKVQKARKDLRIIISSATIDASLFFDFFNKKDKKVFWGFKKKNENLFIF